MVFQFEHVEGMDEESKWNTRPVSLLCLKRILSKWQTGLHDVGWNSLFLSNHDQPRSVSRFGNDSDEYRERSAKMLATCLHMMQGTPYVYQGEELGMTNYPFTEMSQFRDLETINAYRELVEESHKREPEELIRCFQHRGRDNARTPMQWDDSENAGFSTGTPWIDVNPNYREVNARAQQQDPESVFSYYKKLIRLRKEHDIIVYGSYRLLMEESDSVFAYVRTLGEQKLLVLCNFTRDEQALDIPAQVRCSDGEVLISNYGKEQAEDIQTLRPYEAIAIWQK